jgi:hypothetical protein
VTDSDHKRFFSLLGMPWQGSVSETESSWLFGDCNDPAWSGNRTEADA